MGLIRENFSVFSTFSVDNLPLTVDKYPLLGITRPKMRLFSGKKSPFYQIFPHISV